MLTAVNKNNQTIAEVLLSLSDTVKWLSSQRITRTADLPLQQSASIKRLEALGFVSRTGSGLYVLQRERLKKVMNRMVARTAEERERLCFQVYESILNQPGSYISGIGL